VAEQKSNNGYKCCDYFTEALDPNIRKAFLGYCKAREWPFTVMVPIGGLEGTCPKPPIPQAAGAK
jgi:hypothetical protein